MTKSQPLKAVIASLAERHGVAIGTMWRWWSQRRFTGYRLIRKNRRIIEVDGAPVADMRHEAWQRPGERRLMEWLSDYARSNGVRAKSAFGGFQRNGWPVQRRRVSGHVIFVK